MAELDLSGKQCPCASGYVCDGARNVCVLSLGADASLDSGVALDGQRSGEAGGDTAGGSDGMDGRVVPDTSPPPTCDAGLDSDPMNCGSCGHDCLGGACQAGACQPVALALVTGGRGAVAVDDVNVYFPVALPTSGVQACAKTGCNNTPTVVATDTGTVSVQASIATDGTNVYWVNSTDVMQCAVGGCNGQPTHLATGQNNPHSVVVDSTSVYWLTFATTSGGSVMKCAIGGAGGPTTFATDSIDPEGVAVDATNLYWTDYDATTGLGQVQSCPVTGCTGAPLVLANNQSLPSVITLDPNAVYWLAGGPNVLACAKGGCGNAPTSLATNLTQPSGLVVDSTRLFVSVASGAGNRMGQVLFCPIGGCNNTYSVLAADPSRPTTLAEDATAVYWIDTAGGIWKVAK